MVSSVRSSRTVVVVLATTAIAAAFLTTLALLLVPSTPSTLLPSSISTVSATTPALRNTNDGDDGKKIKRVPVQVHTLKACPIFVLRCGWYAGIFASPTASIVLNNRLSSYILSTTTKTRTQVSVEALCPGCQEFMNTQLVPVYDQLSSAVIELEVVPYGNAMIVVVDNETETEEVKCQHGPGKQKDKRAKGNTAPHINIQRICS